MFTGRLEWRRYKSIGGGRLNYCACSRLLHGSEYVVRPGILDHYYSTDTSTPSGHTFEKGEGYCYPQATGMATKPLRQYYKKFPAGMYLGAQNNTNITNLTNRI